MPAAYFLGQRLLCTAATAPWWAHADPWCASLAYLCPDCGDLWARVAIEGRPWHAIMRRCPRCGDGHLIHPWSVPLNTYPPQVLEREALLILERWNDHTLAESS